MRAPQAPLSRHAYLPRPMPAFESTLPAGAPELMRASAFRDYLEQESTRSGAASTRLSTLQPSVLQDLLRFERSGRTTELLEVVAASLRHGHALLVHTEHGRHVLPLTLFPRDRLLHAPMPLPALLDLRLDAFEVLQVEPAVLRPPRPGGRGPQADRARCAPLDPFVWELALRGRIGELLPELAGAAAYRVAPAADLRALGLDGTLAAAVERLRRETINLREIAGWPGFDRARAMRMLNALYLLSALIVSRTHPAAMQDGWRVGLGRV